MAPAWADLCKNNQVRAGVGAGSGRAGRCRQEGGDPEMGGGALGRKARQLPLPELERGRMRSPPWGGGVVRGRAPGGRARVAPGARGHLRSVRGTLRSGKQDSVRDSSCAPRAVPEEKATRPPSPTAPRLWDAQQRGVTVRFCRELGGLGEPGSGRASVTNPREKDLGPKEK